MMKVVGMFSSGTCLNHARVWRNISFAFALSAQNLTITSETTISCLTSRVSSRTYSHANAFRTSPCFTMFRRSIASSATVPKRREDLPVPEEYQKMRKEPLQPGLHETLDDFFRTRDSDHGLICEEDIVHVARRIATSRHVSSMLTDGENTRHLSSRVNLVLQEIEARKATKSRQLSLPYTCLTVLVHLLRSRYSDARVLVASLSIASFEDLEVDEKTWINAMHSFLLLASSRHGGAVDAFAFFIEHYPATRIRDWDENHVGRMVSLLDKGLASLLESLPLPANFLIERKTSWSSSRRGVAAFILVLILLRHSRTEDGLLVFEEALSQQLELPTSLHEQLIRALVRVRMHEQASVHFGLLPPPNGNKAVRARDALGLYLFAHQGKVEEAEECFERIRTHGLVNPREVTLLMHASAVRGDVERVLGHFNFYFGESSIGQSHYLSRPNIQHYGAILNAFAEKDDLAGLDEWLGRMINDGISPDRSIFNTILKAFALRGDLQSMRNILDQMKQAGTPADHVSYTTIIKVLARRGDVVAAETMYKRMVEDGHVPDGLAVTTLMNAHAEAGSWNGVIRVFDYLRNSAHKALAFRVEIFNTLLKAYVLIGTPFDVVSNIFRRYETTAVRPNKYTFALLIQSACDNGLLDTAAQLFVEMEEASKDWTRDLNLSPHIFSIIIAAFLRRGRKSQALDFYNDMQSRGIQPTSYTFASFLRTYAADTDEGSLQSAQELLSSLVESPNELRSWRKPNSGREGWLAFLYAPLLQAYIVKMDMAKVEEQYAKYLEVEEEPSIGILTLLLDARRRDGNVEGVQQIWPQIVERALTRTREVDDLLSASNVKIHAALGNLRRTDMLCIPLSIYIDAISRTGNHVEIAHTWNFLRDAGFQFDAHNWNHLVVALIRAGQPLRAFEVVEKVIVPYEQQARSIARDRSDSPPSPYLFDDEASIAQTREEPFGRQVGRPSEKRGEFAKLLREQHLHVASGSDDYAHELYQMQLISPAWAVWRAHGVTLRALASVLRVLDSGQLIKPMHGQGEVEAKNEGDVPKPHVEGEDRAKVEQKAARSLLNQILIDYPRTIARVDSWEKTMAMRRNW